MSPLRQVGMGWLAPLVALAGLCLSLAGAYGWGEVPRGPASPELIAPPNQIHNSSGHQEMDAGPPDGPEDEDDPLVGLLS